MEIDLLPHRPVYPGFYPTEVASVPLWASETGTPYDEARRRFLQHAMILSILADPLLADRLVLQGASALRLIYGMPRRSKDLDYVTRSRAQGSMGAQLGDEGLDVRARRAIQACLPRLTRGLAVAPPGYRDSIQADIFLAPDGLLPVPVKIPLQDAREESWTLQVAPIEQLLANKLHAVLSAGWRPKRDRSRDVWDIAWILDHQAPDLRQAADALRVKLASEGRTGGLLGLLVPGLRERAGTRYEKSVPPSIWSGQATPFADAWYRMTKALHMLDEFAH